MGWQRQEESRMKQITAKPCTAIPVRTSVRAGGISMQHSQPVAAPIRVRTNVRAGGETMQHSQAVAAPSRTGQPS
jgi:hypothetical protein